MRRHFRRVLARGFAPDTAEEAFIIGVHFKPGGAFPFLGLPAGDLADTHVDLETLWGPSAGRLRERLCEARTSAERFQLLQEALLSRLCHGVEQLGHRWAGSGPLPPFPQHRLTRPWRRVSDRDVIPA